METQSVAAGDELESVFEERAEFLSEEELERWTRLTAREQSLVKQLCGPGAKLLVGPRGCGKSTLLRTAYFSLLRSNEALPAYVNYSRSLALEPMFHSRSDAIPLFRQWVLAKIVSGVGASFRDKQAALPAGLSSLLGNAEQVIRLLELGRPDAMASDELTPSQVQQLLEELGRETGQRRVVLLLDDAAHAFASEQQREFFEIFRELRSRLVAPKAAIYPGVTSFSPNFHVGHEASVLQAWYGVDDPGYLESMRTLVSRRLPAGLQQQLAEKDDLVDYFALAAFGLPRTFLNLVAHVVENASLEPRARQIAPKAVEMSIGATNKVFTSLGAKLPKLINYVALGASVQTRLVESLQRFNKLQSEKPKATVVAIEEPVSKNLERILHMLEYAGLVREVDSVSRGVKGTFRRYQVHYGLLIAENALLLGKSVSLKATSDALLVRDSHAFVRVKSTGLLTDSEDKGCTVNLLPCARCGTQRSLPDQRFCMKCGAELRDSSVYLDLLSTPVDELPLPKAKIDGIKARTSLRTVHDVLMDDEAQQLRTIPWVGPVWSKRIRTVAEEFVGV